MTDLDTLQRSVESSKPVEIYEFTLGSGAPALFTSSEDLITFDSQDYLPESIERNSIIIGTDERQRMLEVRLPLTNSFVSQFIGIPPGERTTVVVRRLQRNAVPATSRLLFDGFLQSVRFPDDRWAIIGVQSLEASLAQIIPRMTFQGLCNHFLYDNQCGVNPVSFKLTSALVTGEADNIITVTGAAASGLDFTGGFVTPVGVNDFRMVTLQSGDNLSLLLPFKQKTLGLTVDVFAGCNRSIDGDCLQVFDNVEEHGGWAFGPPKNPFATGIITT